MGDEDDQVADPYAPGASFETGFNESFHQTATEDSSTVLINSEVFNQNSLGDTFWEGYDMSCFF